MSLRRPVARAVSEPDPQTAAQQSKPHPGEEPNPEMRDHRREIIPHDIRGQIGYATALKLAHDLRVVLPDLEQEHRQCAVAQEQH